ncbi:hypothetical protein MP228_012095 [Amoeboaphelidium protococcarum]|nr:hypothetical protein MP228_012095 [Amoeboaphelidium protococcarum]
MYKPVVTSPVAHPKTTLLFSISDKIGALDEVLQILKQQGVNLSRIESRPSITAEYDYDFFVELNFQKTVSDNNGVKSDDDPAEEQRRVNAVVNSLKSVVSKVNIVASSPQSLNSKAIPWFPRRKYDLDSFAEKVLSYGAELDADHPGFKDLEYRKRRDEITAIARTYKTNQPIPHIEYTESELQTWSIVFNKLTQLYPTHACRQHQYVFPLLIQNCGYSDKNIPQLEDISRFLKDCTGFTLRPVMGLLSSRDFLNGLAFRVFHSTQYIRHHSKPFYTPEPDVCHELLGHVPLFADPEFAEFSQEIGLASLGASDDDIKKLATIYWFTVEFGVCKEGDQIKAYGAGLLSSFGELEYCVGKEPKLLPFDPEKAAVTDYPITQYQPQYYVAESFRDATDKVRQFASSMDRQFSVRYNAYTESIEVLDSKEKVVRYASSIRSEYENLIEAISKLQ